MTRLTPTLPLLPVSFVLTLLGCAPTTVAADDDDSTPEPVREVAYYLGTQTLTFTGGGDPVTEEVLLRRVVDEAQGWVDEAVARAEGEPLHIRQDVEGDAFTFEFDDAWGTFSGHGEYTEGDPWHWTRWWSDSEYIDGPYVGSSVHSEDERRDDGHHADKVVRSPEGAEEATISEDLALVTEAAFHERAAEWGWEVPVLP
jgi:hypothetical protein